MPRRFLKSYLPDRRFIRGQKSLRFLGDRLHHPGLWHLGRRSVAGGLAVGVFVAFIPLPGQMLIAAIAALLLHVNLPLAVVTVWITNPVTIPPMFYFNYRVGAWLLDSQPINLQFELSWDWLLYNLSAIWQPLLLGSLCMGVLFALIAYLAVSLIWRAYVVLQIRRRRQKNAATINKPPPSTSTRSQI